MGLDPLIAAVLETMLAGPEVYRMPVAAARIGMEARVEMLKALAPSGVTTRNIAIPGPEGPVPARLYRPDGGSDALPTLVYLHGGGWALGSLETHDNLCRFLAARGPLLVISVGYRLAPEHKAPAQQEDVQAALQWADAYASYAENAAFGLNREGMEWFWGLWLAEGAGPDDSTAPMRAADLSGLPPAYVITASHDVLRDEGKAYAGRLGEAGALAAHDHVPGTIHGFASLAGLVPLATQTVERAARWAALVKATA